MREYLVDVPVVLYAFIRPNDLKKVFNILKVARPSSLFIISDGPRDGFKGEKELIDQSRKVVEHIDWNCQVKRLYFETNQGIYSTFKQMCEFVFQHVDRFIFLEDDVLPSISFFRYCEELLERYKDDLRINMICGMNHQGVYDRPKTDYFFTRGAASIWGFAIWKRTYKTFYNFSFGEDDYIIDTLLQNTEDFSDFQNQLIGYCKNKNFNGHIAGPEFFLGLSSFAQNQLSIIPKKNMVCNIGYGVDSSSFSQLKLLPKSIAALFNMKTYNLEFPLKHPEFIIEDNFYKREVLKTLDRQKSVISKFGQMYRQIVYGNKREYFKRLYNKIIR